MRARNKQILPSGEVRIYEADDHGVLRLVKRTTAGGSDYDGAGIGEDMEAAEKRFIETRPKPVP